MSDTAESEMPQGAGGPGVAAAPGRKLEDADAVAAADEALHESIRDGSAFVGVEEFGSEGGGTAGVEAALDGAQEALDAAVAAVEEGDPIDQAPGPGEGRGKPADDDAFVAASEFDAPEDAAHADSGIADAEGAATEADGSQAAADDPGEVETGGVERPAGSEAAGARPAAQSHPGKVGGALERRPRPSLGVVVGGVARGAGAPVRVLLMLAAMPVAVLPEKLRKVVGIAAVVTLLNALLTWAAVLMIPPSARLPRPDPVDSSHGSESSHGGGVQREGKVEASGAERGSHSGGGKGGGHAKGGGHDSKKSGGHGAKPGGHDKKSGGGAKKSAGHDKKGGGGGGHH